ncbi:MAG: amidohydrolase [candidate division WOR-3 bacterium]
MSFILLKNCNFVNLKKNKVNKCDILITNGRISKIISNPTDAEKLDKFLHRNFVDFKIFDIKNNYLISGFADSHTHLLAHGIELQRVDLSKCFSLDECIEKLKMEKEREIIFGVNWDESLWKKGKKNELNRKILDKISKNKPVVMRRVCGHFAVCNTRALDFISKEWKIVDRENGWLYEDAALYLNRIFKPNFEMYKKGLELATRHALSLGITSIHEITDINGFKIYQLLKKQIKLRVALYITTDILPLIGMGIQSNFGNDFLKFSGLKIFMDGSIGAQTAAIRTPYKNSRNRGKILVSEKNLLNLVRMAESNSIQLMIHSIGDRSTDLVLKVFKQIGIRKNQLRHRLEHIEILHSKQIKEISKLNLIASMQPNFLRWQFPDNMYEKALGLRFKGMNCFKKIKKAGIKLIFGSDCMPLGPLYGIKLAVNHPFYESRLSPAEAITLYTQSPPFATFDENNKGMIEEGKFADIVVLNKNPLIKENLDDIKILKVFVDGCLVYKN